MCNVIKRAQSVGLTPASLLQGFLLLLWSKSWDHAALLGCAHILAAVLVPSHDHAGYSPSLFAIMGGLALAFNCLTSENVSQVGRPVVLHLPEYGALLL